MFAVVRLCGGDFGSEPSKVIADLGSAPGVTATGMLPVEYPRGDKTAGAQWAHSAAYNGW